MAKAKMKATKKTKSKVKAKVKAKVVKPKTNKLKGFGRGYNVVLVNKTFNFGGGPELYEVYEVSGPKVEGARIFVDEDSVRAFIGECDMDNVQVKALNGKSYGGIMARQVMREHKDLMAEKDLPELTTDLPEKCDKTSIEDIDA